jgi:hypothetical protein
MISTYPQPMLLFCPKPHSSPILTNSFGPVTVKGCNVPLISPVILPFLKILKDLINLGLSRLNRLNCLNCSKDQGGFLSYKSLSFVAQWLFHFLHGICPQSGAE